MFTGPQENPLQEWLSDHKLTAIQATLEEEGYMTLHDLRELTDHDVSNIKVALSSLKGDR